MAGAAREHWSSRTGFILAAVGSAVGLGNMWRFAYITAEYGGAAFVLLYLVFTFAVGLPVMLAELLLGRGSQKSPVGALAHYGGGAWRPLGLLFVASGFLILSYYGVIAGWTVRYAGLALLGDFSNSGDLFGEISKGWDAVGFHLFFMLGTVAIVAGGVKGGIERTAMVMMPALFVIVVGLAVYAATLPGSGEGYAYYLSPDFSKIWSLEVLREAAGQTFFSLSLGMGAILTFGSYLGRDSHLPRESVVIAFADLGVAFFAGLVVFPLIFALGLSGLVGEGTLGALFITLPSAFDAMGGIGRFVGLAFFVALFVGALTSAISLLEVVVASAMDGLGWERRRAAWITGGAIAALGVWPALDTDVLAFMDALAGNVFLVAGGLALSVYAGWFMERPEDEILVGAPGLAWLGIWRWLLRVPVPLVLGIVLWNAVGALAS